LSRAQLGADLLGVVVASTVEGNTLRSNTIARNIEDGIEIKAAANTLVEGNTTERNGAHGIYLANGADGNRLIKNTVATNKGNGIRANGADVLRNSWSENRVFDNAAGSIATTSRANANMRQPRITAVAGKRVTGTAAPGAVVELFSDIGRQARYFEGRTTAGADGSFTFVVSGQAPNIAATATDANGNSSAMSGSPSEFIFLPIVRR
jgi:parallel beta-helix repeat protein